MTPFAAVTVTWRHAPAGARAAAHGLFGDHASLGRLGADGLVVLHTCARSSWWISAQEPEWVAGIVAAQVERSVGAAPDVHVGPEGLRHAIETTIGLDSFVQGEADIGRQVHHAMQADDSRRDRVLNLLNQALEQVRNRGREQGFIRANVGIGALAVAALGGLSPDTVVGVVGAGAIGTRVVVSLRRSGWKEPVLYNRSQVEGARPLDALEPHDAWIVCTAGPMGWFSPPGQRRVVVDLGVPAQVSDADAIGVDALVSGEMMRLPPRLLALAEQSVAETLSGLLGRLKAPQTQLGRVRDVRDRFLASLDLPLDGVPAEHHAAVLRATKAAIRTYTHQIVRALGEA